MSCGPFSLKPFRQSVVEGNVTPYRCLELIESASYCSNGHFDLAMVVSFFTIRFLRATVLYSYVHHYVVVATVGRGTVELRRIKKGPVIYI